MTPERGAPFDVALIPCGPPRTFLVMLADTPGAIGLVIDDGSVMEAWLGRAPANPVRLVGRFAGDERGRLAQRRIVEAHRAEVWAAAWAAEGPGAQDGPGPEPGGPL